MVYLQIFPLSVWNREGEVKELERQLQEMRETVTQLQLERTELHTKVFIHILVCDTQRNLIVAPFYKYVCTRPHLPSFILIIVHMQDDLVGVCLCRLKLERELLQPSANWSKRRYIHT